jgi:zinc protease
VPASASDPLRIERRLLASGLELVYQPSPPGAPSFSATYLGPGGWGFDPAGLEGLSYVAARLLPQSSQVHDRRDLARLLDRYGASLVSTSSPETTGLTLWGPADAWDRLIGLLADAILRPRFVPEDLERVRRQVAERQLRESSQPDLRAPRELLRSLYPAGHPYRSTGIGTTDSVRKIRRADIERFHRSHFVAEGASLVVTTPHPIAEVLRTLERLFAPWPTGHSAPSPPTDLPSDADRRRVDVPMADQSQVEVRIGGRSLPRRDVAYPALFLANEILGGRPLLSRLFQRVRERHGLAYHASSDLKALRWGGYWVAQAGTDAVKRDRVVSMIQDEVSRLASDPVPRSELDRIRESVLGSLPLELESTADAHELAVEIAYHRLPTDFYAQWPARLRAIGPAEVRAAAEVGMNPERCVTVTVGPPPRSGRGSRPRRR